MNIKCKCGHEIKAADYNQGRLTKCPKCSDSVALVPKYPTLKRCRKAFRFFAAFICIGTILSVLMQLFGPGFYNLQTLEITAFSGSVSALALFTAGELIQVVLDYVGRAR